MNKPQRREDAERKRQEAKKGEGRGGQTRSSPPGARSFRARLVRWFEKNARDLPWRHTREPYAVLVSEIMLQQTQVATVIPFYERWMKRFPDVAALAAADENEALRYWQGLGYYSRARNLRRAARVIVEQHGGEFPRKLADIRTLPGVGRYTAGAVATFAFDDSTPIVDANIGRVLARIFNVQIPIDSGAGQRAIWQHATDLQPRRNARLFNEALMELGALVCVPRTPKCPRCPVAGLCRSKAPEELPIKRPRRTGTELIENCALVVSRGRILLEQQTGSRWHGMWKLPALASPPDAEPVSRLEYPFTHHRVRLSVFKTSAPGRVAKNQRWHRLNTLDAIAIPAPHRRVLRALRTLAL